jgi:hypothetical protein
MCVCVAYTVDSIYNVSVAYTVDIRAFVAHETVMLVERKLITGHEFSGAAVTKDR